MNSEWKKYDIKNKIRDILIDAKPHAKHHFGSHSFVSSYQITLEFKRRFPTEFLRLSKNLGGKGSKKHIFAQYIGRQISGRIKSGEFDDIEGAFLYRRNLLCLQYRDKQCVKIKSTQSYDLALFKIKDK